MNILRGTTSKHLQGMFQYGYWIVKRKGGEREKTKKLENLKLVARSMWQSDGVSINDFQCLVAIFVGISINARWGDC